MADDNVIVTCFVGTSGAVSYAPDHQSLLGVDYTVVSFGWDSATLRNDEEAPGTVAYMSRYQDTLLPRLHRVGVETDN